MGFGAHCLELELDTERVVKPLLRKVRKLGDLSQAPEERSGCKDCELLEELVGLLRQK